MAEQNCPINGPDLAGIEVVSLRPANRVSSFQEAATLARELATQCFEEYMLVSWYDRDRDFESPPNSTECAAGCVKNGYIHYGLSHGAKLKVDVDSGRFVFFFTPMEW